ncbi:MAG: hypothetical protein ACLQVL_27950 [Terriglobia bacterium]
MKTIQPTRVETCTYPSSDRENQFCEKTEMTRGQIIEKTLREMGRFWSRADRTSSNGNSRYIAAVIAELNSRLPDGSIKTCGDFRHLNAACCDTCHEFCPHHDMKLVDLPDGGKAWVCHATEWAIYPQRYAEFMERTGKSREGKLFGKILGYVDSLDEGKAERSPCVEDLNRT